MRQKTVCQALGQGHSPFFSFSFYSGYPHLRFYGPLFAFLSGFLGFVLSGNLVLASKLLLFLLHLGSGAVMFWYLARRAGFLGAALGTIVYLVMPWRVLFVAIGANYPLAALYLALPFIFYAFERTLAEPKPQNGILLGFGMALAVLTHVYYAVLTTTLLVIVLLWNLGSSLLGREHKDTGRVLAGLGIGGLVTVGASAFFLLPFLAEYRSHVFPQLRYWLPPPSLAALLVPWARQSGYAGAYLGLSNVILVLGAAVLVVINQGLGRGDERGKGALRRRSQAAVPLILCLALVLVLAFFAPKWGEFGNALTAGLPPVRLLVFSVFLGAVLVGSGFAWLEERLSRTWKHIVFAGLALVVGADCLHHLVKVRYGSGEEFMAVRQQVYSLVRQQNPTKVLDVNIPGDRIDDARRVTVMPAIGYLFGNLPSPLGPPYHQFAPRSMLYVYPFVNLLASDLGDSLARELGPRSLKAIALVGLSHIITLPTPAGTSEEGLDLFMLKRGIAWDDRFLVEDAEPPLVFGTTGAGLLLASNRTLPMRREKPVLSRGLVIADDWSEFLDAVNIDLEHNVMEFIPVTEEQAADAVPGPVSVLVRDWKVEEPGVRLKVRAENDCFVRLALSYYSELRMLVDGRPMEFGETKDHFIWFRLPAGEHELAVSAPLGVFRQVALGLSAVSLLACFGFLLLPGARRHRSRPAAS